MEEKNHIEHYSNALLSIWSEEEFENKKELTNKSKEIYYSLRNNHEIIKILSSNILSKKERKKIIYDIFYESLTKSNITICLFNFLLILIDNDFFNKVLEIFVSFFEKIDNVQNFIFLRIHSPYWLDDETLKKIEYYFSKKTKKKVRYENMIDKTLIGGMKIYFGDQLFDYSIKGKIEQIKWNLENNKEA